MNLPSAQQAIALCRERMDALYQKPVFDEWVIIQLLANKPHVLSYDGPRAASFQEKLHTDSAPLYAAAESRILATGDFEFVLDAKGSRYDACVKLSDHHWLFCNNTFGSMNDIRQDPRWRQAQKPFFDLSERFRADPLA